MIPSPTAAAVFVYLLLMMEAVSLPWTTRSFMAHDCKKNQVWIEQFNAELMLIVLSVCRVLESVGIDSTVAVGDLV